MTTLDNNQIKADHDAIEALLHEQFAAIAWGDGKTPEWDAFANGFVDGAPLYPAARPIRPTTVDGFAARMRRLSDDETLRTFSEVPQGLDVRIAGNVAVALAGCEMHENGEEITYDVNAILLVKQDGVWRIAAQAWDRTDRAGATFSKGDSHGSR